MRRVLALAGLALGLAGCIAVRMSREAAVPSGDADPRAEEAYQLLLEQHTAEVTLLDGLNTHAVVAATLEGPAFVQARIRRTGSLRAWPEDKIQLEWQRENQRLEAVTEFFVGLQTTAPAHNDLDVRTSIWQLSLRVGDGVHFPSSIRRVGRSTMDMRSFYPHMGLAWVGYRVQFPVALTPPFGATLMVSSMLGKAEFFYLASEGGVAARSN